MIRRSSRVGESTTWKGLAALVLVTTVVAGCHRHAKIRFDGAGIDCADCQIDFRQIEYPDLCDESLEDTSALETSPPPTVENFYEQEKWGLSLEEAIDLALRNSQVLNKLGGIVVAAPGGVNTIYDPALSQTNPFGSAEAALSDFDAQVTSNLSAGNNKRQFNNAFAGFGNTGRRTESGRFDFGLTKTTAAGTELSLESISTYTGNPDWNANFEAFPNYWDQVMQVEVRQPLLRNAGVAVNRIAGPDAVPGSYNGVLVGRIGEDVALADFEAAVRDLVRDVEQNYWELYFAYRDLNVKLVARELARRIWVQSKQKFDAGVSRPDEEAQSRQQYYTFQQQAINALSGESSGQTGVLGRERQLRRLMGLLNNDGRLIRPTSEPTIAPVAFDWESAQEHMLNNRVELRRQKWTVRQRELELVAACNLNRWRLDLVGAYGARGFGDDLFGGDANPSVVNPGPPPVFAGSSAFAGLGNLYDWSLALELRGPVGNRAGHLAVRNAQLALARDKSVLREQHRQLLLDLNAAYAEVDRAFVLIRNSYNSRQASVDELIPRTERTERGAEDPFFLLDAQRRAATIETQYHRSIVDYNLALMNFVYTSGDMLKHYNIRLAEGDWDQSAESDRQIKRAKYSFLSSGRKSNEQNLVSQGVLTDEPGTEYGTAEIPLGGELPQMPAAPQPDDQQ